MSKFLHNDADAVDDNDKAMAISRRFLRKIFFCLNIFISDPGLQHLQYGRDRYEGIKEDSKNMLTISIVNFKRLVISKV